MDLVKHKKMLKITVFTVLTYLFDNACYFQNIYSVENVGLSVFINTAVFGFVAIFANGLSSYFFIFNVK